MARLTGNLLLPALRAHCVRPKSLRAGLSLRYAKVLVECHMRHCCESAAVLALCQFEQPLVQGIALLARGMGQNSGDVFARQDRSELNKQAIYIE
jgi:hypothetical protein